MSITGGFFNSLNGDRKYNAEQLSSIFDGILTEGVFENFGTCFKVTNNGSSITIGTGRAWLNSKWLLNDANYKLSLPSANAGLPRYDAIIFDIDSNLDVRANTIKVISGANASNPTKPALVKDEKHKQYPICYIYRPAGQNSITNENVEIMIGKSALPYITAPLKSISVQDHFNKWDAEFNNWFNGVKSILDSDTATALYNEITAVKTRVANLENKLSDKAITTAGYRQMYAGTSDMTPGNTALATGVVYIMYE